MSKSVQTSEAVNCQSPLHPALLWGDGPIRVIAIHGWMGGSDLFLPFLSEVDAARFSYALLDCKGYGTRSTEFGPTGIAQTAAEVVRLADSLGWKQFHVLGHSMGGMVAQRLMIDAPDRLLSAILLASVPACGAKPDSNRRQLLLNAISDSVIRRDLIDANTGRVRDNSWIDDLLALSLRSTTQQGMVNLLSAWTDTDFAEQAKGRLTPVLALVGALDPGITESRMRDTVMTWYPNAQLQVLEGVGHYPMREGPKALALSVEQFVSRL